ncbi:MAG: hypothetical protein P8M80_06830 [Pirellulaceae bacterium]|jgi:hypothetical protein|nr:hypothetical protein [Mariniblastus sp.]MDB4756573.1 hypothetical protein [Mariniblastus sp.]MDG2468976.1 hypothetical protein [Pirellulaceae bacterium]
MLINELQPISKHLLTKDDLAGWQADNREGVQACYRNPSPTIFEPVHYEGFGVRLKWVPITTTPKNSADPQGEAGIDIFPTAPYLNG